MIGGIGAVLYGEQASRCQHAVPTSSEKKVYMEIAWRL